jgi:hypothetical protein
VYSEGLFNANIGATMKPEENVTEMTCRKCKLITELEYASKNNFALLVGTESNVSVELCPEHGQQHEEMKRDNERLREALKRARFHAHLRGWDGSEGHELYEVYTQMKAALAGKENV